MKNKYIRGTDTPAVEIPVYEYSHTNLNRKDKIREETAALFDLMFRCSDCFSFTITEDFREIAPQIQQRKNPLRDALKPYFVQKFTTYHWYGWFNRELEIFVYRCCPQTREILAEYCPELFIHSIKDKYTVIRHPEFEDLCFYQDGRMILGSLSHEYMCTIYPPDDDDGTFAHSLSYTGEIRKTATVYRYILPEK
ncbi:MAG: hypothetical protein IJY35_12355 [Clostridia bacterium]|nr:hypothetical protein [Clostridia bacterium]